MMVKRDQMALVRQVLWGLSSKDARARELLAMLNSDVPNVVRFSALDIDYISSALINELTATGLGHDFEPTERGLQLEAAIDWVRAHHKDRLR
jgi:hypothetical protein